MAPVHLQLLDDVAVTADGVRTALGGPRQRALVARLALDRGRTIPLDRLIDDLWDGGAPEIRTTLRAYMSRLRATALGPWLSGGRSGYRLADGPGLSVDLWSLEDAVARGAADDDVAVPHVLANWHDAPLGGIGAPPFVADARVRITRAVHTARLQAARAALEAGRIDSALLLLHPLRAAHPDDEDLLALVRVAETRAAVGDRAFHSLAVRDASGEGATAVRPAAAPSHRMPASPMTRRTGIPGPIAGIVGRSEERAAITAALDVSRLVTLTGPAGVGKTRLAVDWLGTSAVAGEEHIWFVGLSAAAGGEVGERIASVVGAPAASAPGIAAHLADRRGILVLDGADAALAEVGAIATAVLSNARGLAVLCTARRTLGVPGESVLRIDPLPLADARALLAARLPGDPLEPDATDRLIEQLGRLPLAIELAAARAAVMPLDEVAGSMLRDLHRPAEAESPLAAALRSSLEMLAPDQRDTLRAVAGFTGPFTRDAVAAVCGERDRDSDLDHLVASSLLAAEDSAAGPAFRVSELIRRAALRGATPDREWSRRHREWFAAQSTRASVELTAQGSAARIARVRSEWPDLVAAFDSAVRAEDRATAVAIAGGLLWFAVRSGRQQELLALTRRSSEIPGRADAAAEAQLCLARGFLAYQLGSMPEAAAWISSAREPAERSDDPGLRGLSRAFAAYLLTLAPRAAADPGRELAAALSDLDRMPDAAAAMVMLIGGQVHRGSRHTKEAIALLDRAETLASRCGHDWVALMAPVVAAKVHLDLRQGAPAIAALVPVVRRSADEGDPVSLLIAASVAAGAAAALGDDTTGARIIGAVDAIGRRYGFDPRANEPADFELYLHRVREGLTPAEWRSAYAHSLQCEVEELVDLTCSLSPR
ncbi:AfsR/SARP family transcriptional regulator [Microbacterium sp. SA39]|uniref:AfsR/SARP family transcriptional regulator n=1 Tax=Microbacterium sp. SA39 TaxID=1263625 RepID=UPI0005F9CE2A|nr:BTAD domain-containing putative transcriptional regulator [Microbacterium sp. SA39]KJQ54025.1 putative HTH-type transcriptional regulator [Microbacterium sp. SA39]